MKIGNEQPLTRQEQKLIAQLSSFIGKTEVRSKSKSLQNKTRENVHRLGKFMAANGYQNAQDFKTKTYRGVMQQIKDAGLEKTVNESMHTTCRTLAAAMDKPDMIPLHSSDPKAMGSDDFYRKHGDRIKPQYHTSDEDRRAMQEDIAKVDPKAAISTDMSYHYGTRKEESLVSGEFVKKDADGQLHTTAGVKTAGEYREVNIRQFRYAFSENEKDAAFEKEYVNKMEPGQEYIVVTASWAKNGRARLVPVLNEEARAAAVRMQQALRDNKDLARSMGIKNVQSLIEPGRTKLQGYDHYEYVLRKAGVTKAQAGFSIHADRTEFNQRMKHMVDEDGLPMFSAMDRTLALGHGDIRKLEHYGW